jgi:DNA-binding Lrp family transcriptional regulator
MTGYEKPNYTMTPNKLFETHMKDMGESELKVVLCAVRKILGYHKEKPEAISISQFEQMTGLSRQGVLNGIDAAIERGVIRKVGTGTRNVSLYELNFVDDITTSQNSGLVKDIDQSKELTSTSQNFRPVLVKNVDTQKKVSKEKNKETNIPISASDDIAIADEDVPQDEDTETITTKEARQLIFVYKSYSKNKDKRLLGYALPEAKDLVKAGINPDIVKSWYEHRSQDDWVQKTLNGVPTWGMLAKEIIPYRDNLQKDTTTTSEGVRIIGSTW